MSYGIAYIARATVPSGSTNSIHVAKISDAFAKISDDFRLIVFDGGDRASLTDVYGIRNDFPVYRINRGKDTRLNQIAWACKAVGLAHSQNCKVIVTRDPFCAFVAILRGMQVVLDLHGDIKHLCGRFYRMLRWKWFVDNDRFHLVTISQGLKDYYVQNYGLESGRITVLPDGVDIADFANCNDKALDCNKGSLHIGYFGKTTVGKGIDLIRRVAIASPADVFDVYGGTLEGAVKETGKSFTENVIFHGKVSNRDIPELMCDMDVLVLPNQDKLMNMGEDIGKFTSPLKLFEYMASGRPIIASDLPVIREVLNEENAYLVDFKDETDWGKAISAIKSDSKAAAAKADRAKKDVTRYTWKARAEAMLKLATGIYT